MGTKLKKEDSKKIITKNKKKQYDNEKSQKIKKHISGKDQKDDINRIELRKKMRAVVRERKTDPNYTITNNFASVILSNDKTQTTEDNSRDKTKKPQNKKQRLALKEQKVAETNQVMETQATPIATYTITTTANPPPSYYLSGRTLVLGDGDFSFTASLLLHRKDSHNIIATSYDTLVQLKSKYQDTIAKHLEYIHSRSIVVMHGIDATKLIKYFPNQYTTKYFPKDMPPSSVQQSLYLRYPFDKIFFNFPHSGEQRVHINRTLLRDFFISARPQLSLPHELSYPFGATKQFGEHRNKLDHMLADVNTFLIPYIISIKSQSRAAVMPNNNRNKQSIDFDGFGRIAIVLRDGEPYNSWDIDVQAAAGLFELEFKQPWDASWWKFYHHRTTDVTHNELTGGKAHIYVYRLTNLGIALAIKEQSTLVMEQQQQRLKHYFNAVKPILTSAMVYKGEIESLMNISHIQRQAILKQQRRMNKTHESQDDHQSIEANAKSHDAAVTNTITTTTITDNIEQSAGVQLNKKQINSLTTRLTNLIDLADDLSSQKVKRQKLNHDISDANNSTSNLLNRLVQLPKSVINMPETNGKTNNKVLSQDLFKSFDLSAMMALDPLAAIEADDYSENDDSEEDMRENSSDSENDEDYIDLDKIASLNDEDDVFVLDADDKLVDVAASSEIRENLIGLDFSQSDDIDLSRELYAMLTGNPWSSKKSPGIINKPQKKRR